jgi:hypothetical protein
MKESEHNPPAVLSAWSISPRRIWALAENTVTQLVRMKVFYFLIVFAAIVLVLAAAGLAWKPLEHLLAIKRWSFGAMYIFTMVYSVSATALLLPRDVEDRTLYTVLSKPVPRFEYLAGRLLGVFLVNGIALLVMFGAMALLVWLNMGSVETEFLQELRGSAGTEALSREEVGRQLEQAHRHGVTLSLFWGLWAMYLKSSVISTITLFVSTFASSSLFTIVVSATIAFLGHFHQLAMDYWTYEAHLGGLGKLLAKVMVVVFPNLALFDVVDEVIQGTHLAAAEALRLTGIGGFYVLLFLLLSQLVFVDKEL